jgi:hypothetical protein
MKQLLFLFLLVMLIFSCKKEEPETINYYEYLDPKYLAISPYFNNPEIDTLEFTSNTGDTQIFVKTHIDTTWYVANSSLAEGPTILTNYEQRRANFKCIKGDGYLQVLLATGYPRKIETLMIFWGDELFDYSFTWWNSRNDPDLNHINFKSIIWKDKTYLNGFIATPIWNNTNPVLFHSDKEGIFLIQDSIKNVIYTLNN